MATEVEERGALSPAAWAAGEPTKLVLPAEAVQELIGFALRTELGVTALRFFALAHGQPSWLAPGGFRVVARDAHLLPAGGEEG